MFSSLTSTPKIAPTDKKNTPKGSKSEKRPKIWPNLKQKDRAVLPKQKLIVYISRFQKCFWTWPRPKIQVSILSLNFKFQFQVSTSSFNFRFQFNDSISSFNFKIQFEFQFQFLPSSAQSQLKRSSAGLRWTLFSIFQPTHPTTRESFKEAR